MRFVSRFLLIMAAVIVAGCLAGYAVMLYARGPMTVVPGQSIGKFRIGMSLERAEQILRKQGAVTIKQFPDGKLVCLQGSICVSDFVIKPMVMVTLRTPGRVAFIATFDEKYSFETLRVGSDGDEEATTAVLGKAYAAEFLDVMTLVVAWPTRGIALLIGPNDAMTGITIKAIIVFQRGPEEEKAI
jgi:hypothetical protein